jgi:hypothetical protein
LLDSHIDKAIGNDRMQLTRQVFPIDPAIRQDGVVPADGNPTGTMPENGPEMRQQGHVAVPSVRKGKALITA